MHAVSEVLILAFALQLSSTFRLLVWMSNDASTTRSVWKRMDAVNLTDGILLPVDEVPSLSEVVFQVLNDRPFHGNADVGPSHPAVELTVELVGLPVLHVLEVHDASVVVVLSGEDNFVQISRVSVRDAVLVRIPTSIAEIQTAHESNVAIDKTQLFVVSPVQDVTICKIMLAQ
jgi:hypothetical protein